MHRAMCAYRGNYGRKCAAGWLIPDEKYTPDLEGSSVASSVDETVRLDSIEGRACRLAKIILEEGHDLSLVRDLQKMHDRTHADLWSQEIKDKLQDLARVWGLSTEALG